MSFDPQGLKDLFAGDEEIFNELREDFFQAYREMIDDVLVAASEEDAKKLEISAHTLKGVLSTFCSEAAREQAFSLEKMGKGGILTNARAESDQLATLVEELVADLKKFDINKKVA